ncbi:hypothetical protein B0H13DRAFT_2318831 [Mycena leptocephala]|nr:hypothetical protein B0H13DRAFT_2318831 [Mycena leptocephala]
MTSVGVAFFDALYPLRGHPIWAFCPCPWSFMQHAPRTAFLHMDLPNVGDLAGILILLREGGGVAPWLSRKKAGHAFSLTGVFVSPPSSVRAVYPAPSPAVHLFARRSPLESIPSLQVLTIHGNAIGVSAGCRLIFRPQILIRGHPPPGGTFRLEGNFSADKHKEWKGIKLTPIREDEDGSNNYSEFRQKSILELDAAGYWKYIDGHDYTLRQQVHGVDNTGATVTITVPGYETVVAAARQQAEAWLSGDKKAHAIIVKAVPDAKLYVVASAICARRLAGPEE